MKIKLNQILGQFNDINKPIHKEIKRRKIININND